MVLLTLKYLDTKPKTFHLKFITIYETNTFKKPDILNICVPN